MSHPIPIPGGRLARRSLLTAGAAAAVFTFAPALGAAVIDFGDVNFGAPPATAYAGPGGGVYYNGSDGAGSFSSGGVSFNNSFTDFGGGFTSWAGFAYSNTTDSTTAGFGNQYSAFAPAGGGTYAVGYYDAFAPLAPTISFGGAVAPTSIRLTNNTYTGLDMANGSGFSKKFGGATGDDPDWFKVIITGRDGAHAITGSVEFYLADFRFLDNAQDYIVDEWTTVDLTGLGVEVESIEFYFESSDTGTFGINTPTYVAIDNLAFTAVPEPSAYAALAGLGALAWGFGRRQRRASGAV